MGGGDVGVGAGADTLPAAVDAGALAGAVAEADVVVFVVDVRLGLSAQDYEIGNYLRRLGKPTLLVGNKAEGM